VFKIPEHLILDEVATVPGTDGQKMSKSYGNTIPLFGTREELQKAVMSIVTDSSGERPENVYAIHKLIKDERELEALYEEKSGKYKELKEALIEDLDAFIAPMRQRHDELMDDPGSVRKILEEGAQKAGPIAEEKMKKVREVVGVA
jgi:tryptophanyl-tRNA synthetase